MKIILLPLILICFSAFTQELNWGQLAISNGKLMNHFADKEGNQYLISEYSDSINPNPEETEFVIGVPAGRNTLLQKIDQDGNLLWTGNWISVYQPIEPLTFMDMVADDDGNLYFLGNLRYTIDIDPTETVNTLSSPSGYTDIFVLKLNSEGEFLWCEVFGGDDEEHARSIELNLDNELIISGFFYGDIDFNPADDIDGFSPEGADDIFLLSLDADGGYIWSKSFSGSGLENANDMEIDSDGNIWLAISFFEDLDVNPDLDEELIVTSLGFYDAVLLKLDADANYLSNYVYHGDGHEIIIAIETASDGSCFILGSFSSPEVDLDPSAGTDIYTWEHGVIKPNYFMQKFNPTGDLIWTRVFNSDQINVLDFELAESGNIHVSGDYFGMVDVDLSDTEEHLITPFDDWYAHDVFLLTYNGDGNFLALLDFNQENYETSYEMHEDEMGNIYFSLYSEGYGFDVDPSADEYFLYDEFELNYALTKFLSTPSLAINEPENARKYEFYPNPIQEELTLQLNEVYEEIDIQVMDIEGRVLYNNKFNQTSTIQMNLDVSTGIYFVRMRLDGVEEVFKVVKKFT